MPEPTYILAAIGVAGAITWALRALPFVMFAPLRDSKLLAFLGERMPVGIMLILALYTLRETDMANSAHVFSVFLALAITIAVQAWRKKMIHSIFVGTAVYVVLASAAGI